MQAVLELLGSPVGKAVVYVSLALIMSVVAWYGISTWRDHYGAEDTTSDQLKYFREMHLRGELKETEFRTVKKVLGTRLRRELSDDGEPS